MTIVNIKAAQLCPGDVVVDQYEIRPDATILRWAEWDKDLFGRYEMRFWARREDNGTEGFVSYGPTGIATVLR
jgi:hypothetical protein